MKVRCRFWTSFQISLAFCQREDGDDERCCSRTARQTGRVRFEMFLLRVFYRIEKKFVVCSFDEKSARNVLQRYERKMQQELEQLNQQFDSIEAAKKMRFRSYKQFANVVRDVRRKDINCPLSGSIRIVFSIAHARHQLAHRRS